jgi:hypothetical protein
VLWSNRALAVIHTMAILGPSSETILQPNVNMLQKYPV